MQLRAALYSITGVGLAAGSVWLASFTMQPQAAATKPASSATEFTQILVAQGEIEFGEIISRESLAAQRWPTESIPKGAFTSTSALLGPEGASPRRALEVIPEGGLILQGNISDFGETVSMVNTLGANTRAMSIEVDAVTGVGGFVLPDDRVDIVLTEGRGDRLRTATILQDVRVLSIDKEADETKRARRVARTLTVEVSPRDSQILALGQRAGTLSLTLRTLDAVQSHEIEQISLDDILGSRTPNVVPTASVVPTRVPDPVRTIRVRRGTDAEDVILR